MKFAPRALIAFLNVILAMAAKSDDWVSNRPLSRIAFGSCLSPDQPQPIWDSVVAVQPEIFLFLDETMDINSTNLTDQASACAKLVAQPGYQELLKTCWVWATWNRQDSDSSGLYDARVFGPPGKQVQIIRLDTRAFRGPLTRREKPLPGEGPWTTNLNKSAFLLGANQWTWFRRMLRVPAQLRLILSNIQVIAEDHQGEKWMNFPHERKLLFDMISDTEADGVLFISGNRRHAELSMIGEGAPYPLYDLTSSPLNMRREEPIVEINRHGISEACRDNNFGWIMIDWDAPDPMITLEIRDEKGAARIQHKLSLSALQAAGHEL
jgi:alkaline phosphatase D